MCTVDLTIVFFTRDKMWNQPKSPSDKWVKKMWYAFTMEDYSAANNFQKCHHKAGTEKKLHGFILKLMDQNLFPKSYLATHPHKAN